jgi:hypothetical protein
MKDMATQFDYHFPIGCNALLLSGLLLPAGR